MPTNLGPTGPGHQSASLRSSSGSHTGPGHASAGHAGLGHASQVSRVLTSQSSNARPISGPVRQVFPKRAALRSVRNLDGDLPFLPRAAHASGTWHTGPDPRRSMLFACVGVSFAIVLGTFVSAYLGALALSITMIGAGIWRAWAPKATRAAGIAVRSKWFDVAFYWAVGFGIAILTFSYPEALVGRWG